MSWIYWVGVDEGSSFLEEIVELSIFFSGVIILSDLIGDSWYSDVNLGDLVQRQLFSRAESFFLLLCLLSEY